MTTTSADLVEILERFLRGARPSGVVSAYLFGSHAEDRSHRESDVDVALILDRTALGSARERFELRVTLTSEFIHALGRNEVDVVVLNDAPPLFARQVLSTGVEVFCSDRDLDREFRRDVQLRAADLEPFLEKYRQSKLAALVR